jgi:hypothetical protein
MRIAGLTFIAAVLASVVSAKPTPPAAAIHGHKIRAAPPSNSTAHKVSSKAKINTAAVPFSTSGSKFVTYIDNTVSLGSKRNVF